MKEAPVSEEKEPKEQSERHQDLEVKDAQYIFYSVWKDLENRYGRSGLRFPKELILLGGAPGAGKGTNTPFMMDVRSLTCQPLVISSLLDTPEMNRVKESGGLVGDREVVQILFERLLEPDFSDGAVIDGFPRTFVQVECMKLLYHKMLQLRVEFYNTEFRPYFRQPIVHIMMLFIDEKESVARQMKRGLEAQEEYEEAIAKGQNAELNIRATDLDEGAARRRYQVFKEQTYDALQSLREVFHYHFINAQGSLPEVQENIVKELSYQSSLELDPKTFDSVHRLPIASKIIEHARQELVKRLDSYELEEPELFHQVIDLIEADIMPIVLHHAITGMAHVNSENPIWGTSRAMQMLIDIFSERGYHASIDVHKIEIPERFDLKTGEIECRLKVVRRIQIQFRGSEIRRGLGLGLVKQATTY